MRLPLRQLREIARTAGVKDVPGFPASALMAAIAVEESAGDTRRHSDVRDPNTGKREPSYGLLQINEPSWPEIAAATRATFRQRMPDYTRAMKQMRLAAPIFRDAGQQAAKAIDRLRERGLPAGPMEFMLLIDAAWQGPLGNWADTTSTGNVEEIRAGTIHHNPERRRSIRRHLSELGVVNSPATGIGALLGFLGFGSLIALLLWAIGGLADEA